LASQNAIGYPCEKLGLKKLKSNQFTNYHTYGVKAGQTAPAFFIALQAKTIIILGKVPKSH
jgi:hypothetical protein